MGKFCGNCGAPLNPEAKFCGSCGAAVESAQRSSTPAQGGAVSPSESAKRPRKKRGLAVLALLVVAALGIGFLPRLLSESKLKPVTVTRHAEPLTAQTASEATAIALRQYVYARLATEAFAAAVLEGMSVEEIKALTEDAAQAWEDAELSASVGEEIAAQATEVLETPTIRKTAASGLPQVQFMTLAGAPAGVQAVALAEGSPQTPDPKTWAESLTKQYDALKGAKRYQQLARQLGSDAKTAYEQMELAQKILHDDAMAEAEYKDSLLKAAQVIKTASKVGVFVTATIVTGGGTLTALPASGFTLAQTAGTIIGGVDCIVDVADTGSTVFLGEDNQVALAAAEAKKYLGPVSSVFGLLSWQDAASGEKLAYVGDALSDWFFEGKVAGVQVFADRDGGMKLTVNVMEATGEAGLRAALKTAGYVFPDNENIKALSDIMNGWRPNRELMIARLDALSAQMAAIQQNPELYGDADENGLEAIPEDELEEWKNALEERENEGTEPPVSPMPSSPPIASSISGTYVCDISGPYASESVYMTIQDNSDGTAVVSNFEFWDLGSERLNARYDADTGHFFFDIFEAVFTHTSGGLTASGEFYIEGQKHTVALSRISD